MGISDEDSSWMIPQGDGEGEVLWETEISELARVDWWDELRTVTPETPVIVCLKMLEKVQRLMCVSTEEVTRASVPAVSVTAVVNGNGGRAGKRGVVHRTARTQQPPSTPVAISSEGRRSETKDGKTSPGNDGVPTSFLLPFPKGGPDSPPTASDSGREDASPSSRAEGGSGGRGGGGGAANGGGGGGGGGGSDSSGGSSGDGGGGGCNAVLSAAAANADAATRIDGGDIYAAEPPMAEGEEKFKSAAGDPDLYTDHPNKVSTPHESSSDMHPSSTPARVVRPSPRTPPPPPPPCRQTIGIVDLSLLHEWLTVLLHRTIPGAKQTKPSPGADYAARAAAAIAAIEGTTPAEETEGGEGVGIGGRASGRGDSRSSPKQEAEEDARAHLQRRRKERREKKLEQQRQQKETGKGKGKSGGESDVLHPHYLEKKEEGKAEAEEGAKKKHMSLKSVLAATQTAVSVHFASKKFLSTVQLRRITRACLEWATTPIGNILHVRLRTLTHCKSRCISINLLVETTTAMTLCSIVYIHVCCTSYTMRAHSLYRPPHPQPVRAPSTPRPTTTESHPPCEQRVLRSPPCDERDDRLRRQQLAQRS